MITQKGRPTLGRLRTPRRSPHPAQYGSLRKIEAKHFQFTVDARCTPCGIFRYHAKDQFTQFLAEAFSASANPTPREPRPIQLEPCAVKGARPQWVQFPPGNWIAPPGSNRSSRGGNEFAGAFDVTGRVGDLAIM